MCVCVAVSLCVCVCVCEVVSSTWPVVGLVGGELL